jgi:ADP-ribose pyrophosphatase
MEAWETLTRTRVLDRGRFLQVEDHCVRLPDGRVIEEWPWLVTPDYVNAVVITEDDRWLLFRQTKYAVGALTLAVPGGYLEPDEVPLDAARREVLEETGYEAAHWQSLGAYVVDGNRGNGTGHFFLATGARQVALPDADDLEEQEMLLLTRDETKTALIQGAFRVMPWSAIVALALLWLNLPD